MIGKCSFGCHGLVLQAVVGPRIPKRVQLLHLPRLGVPSRGTHHRSFHPSWWVARRTRRLRMTTGTGRRGMAAFYFHAYHGWGSTQAAWNPASRLVHYFFSAVSPDVSVTNAYVPGR